MADLNDLPLVDEGAPPVDFNELPPERGGIKPLPPAGFHNFRLPPAHLLSKSFEIIQTEKGQRLAVVFSDEAELFVMDTGDTMRARITTEEFGRGKEKILVSNFAYLLNALGETKAPASQKGYGELLKQHAGETFQAEVVYTAMCNPKNDIYKDGSVQPGVKGCGRKYKQQGYKPRDGGPEVFSIPRDDTGNYAHMFECKCGSILRCFGNLQNFRPTK